MSDMLESTDHKLMLLEDKEKYLLEKEERLRELQHSLSVD